MPPAKALPGRPASSRVVAARAVLRGSRSRDSRTPDAEAFKHVEKHAFDRELIVINCGPDANVIRFIPPLMTTREELDWALDLVDEGLASWESQKG